MLVQTALIDTKSLMPNTTESSKEKRLRVEAELKLHNHKQNMAAPILITVVFGIMIVLVAWQWVANNYQDYQENQEYYQTIDRTGE